MSKVLLLFGGNSSEHEISCKSIINVIKNIDTNLFEYKTVGITKDGRWIECNLENIINNDWYNLIEIENIIKYLKQFDLVFPVMHGAGGEDGKLGGMLELFNIDYVGSKMEASAIGMNKYLSKIFFDFIGIPQIPYIKYNNNIDKIIDMGFPLIVKPCNGGSSIGINKVNNIEELKNAINEALIYDKNIIVEKFINAREFECAVLETDNIIVSDVGEIKFNNSFYDYEDKYKNHVDIVIPADIEDNIRSKIKNYSKTIFTKLGCHSLCRIDFLYDKDENKLYLNEINTLPGFTNISMYPMLMENVGYTYKNLITTLIKDAKHVS